MERTKNCHIVSQCILKNFGSQLSVFDLNTQTLSEGRGLKGIYTSDYFYSQEIEDLLNVQLESRISNLLKHKLLVFGGDITLTREEVGLIKKFMAVSVARSIYEDMFINHYMYREEILDDLHRAYCESAGIEYKKMEYPFKEKKIKGETTREYWLRSLKALLETDFTYPQNIEKHPDVTNLAYHWAYVALVGYLGFWDADTEEFVITDVGMTSENEKGWSETKPNHIKMDAALMHAKPIAGQDLNISFKSFKNVGTYQFMHENFMMFPLSGKRLLVSIHPYFKYIYDLKTNYGVNDFPPLSDITILDNESLFKPNENVYSEFDKDGNPVLKRDDKYIYKPVKLKDIETRYCNTLFMDRVNSWLGFRSLRNIRKSVLSYKLYNKGFIPRNDYHGLYEIIWKRFGEEV